MKVICKNNELREGSFEEAWVREAFWHTNLFEMIYKK